MKLHRSLGITQKSAWHMAHRIRKALSLSGCNLFEGPLEVDLRSSNRILTFGPQVMPSGPPDRTEYPEIAEVDPSLARIDLDWYVHKDKDGNDFAAAEADDRTYVLCLEGPYRCVASVIVHNRSEERIGRSLARWSRWGLPRRYWTPYEAKPACEQNALAVKGE